MSIKRVTIETLIIHMTRHLDEAVTAFCEARGIEEHSFIVAVALRRAMIYEDLPEPTKKNTALATIKLDVPLYIIEKAIRCVALGLAESPEDFVRQALAQFLFEEDRGEQNAT